jgi:hypothetical protein
VGNPVQAQIAKRRAVAKATKRVFVASSSHFRGKMNARVLVDGEYYDVDERGLDRLLDGVPPAELGLTPVANDALGDEA